MSPATRVPPLRYAQSGDVSLAYQDFGEGPVTIVVLLALVSNVEISWENEHPRRWWECLASFSRVIAFDRRGTGASGSTVPLLSIDTRVADTLAVMDAAGVEHAFLYGVSEGGPSAMVFAAAHPSRTDGLILDSTAARLAPQLAAGGDVLDLFQDAGADASRFVSVMAPSLLHDTAFIEWWSRYQRLSASPAATRALMKSRNQIDVRSMLGGIGVPTLARHRKGNRVLAVELARETVAAIPGAQLMEFDGDDHLNFAGPDLDAWFEALRAFTGATTRHPLPAPGAPSRQVTIRTLGRFAVEVDGEEVAVSDWGSRRARQLCKRLAAACGRPVAREQLTDLLWPDETDSERLRARLSAQLSTVRRVLGGGVIADRESVRLDLDRVRLDVAVLHAAAAADDVERVVSLYGGDFLPEDVYDDWAAGPRDRARSAFITAARILGDIAAGEGNHAQGLALAQRVLATDPFDEDAHRRAIDALVALRRLGEARAAYAVYERRMHELGVDPTPVRALSPDGGAARPIGRKSEESQRTVRP